MNTLVNFIGLVIFILLSILIYSPLFDKKRIFALPGNPHYSFIMGKNMYFLTFIVCTAPFYLGAFSLIKYAIYFIATIIILLKKENTFKFDSIVKSYVLFYVWLLVSCIYTTFTYDTLALLIKYSIPLLSLWLGYNAIDNKYDMYYFAKGVIIACSIYALIIGGISAKFTPWLYFFIPGLFLKYAGLADYFTSLIILPLVLTWLTGQRKYIFIVLWLLLSAILESVRTGIGGIFIVICFYGFFRYKLKSLPVIAFALAGFVSIILFVPSVNEKFFGDKAGEVQAKDIVADNALSLDNIQTSGRSYLWDLTLTKFYEPHKITGSGLGTVTHFMKIRAMEENTVALLHSDYVQVLCDTGIIGLALLILFYLNVLYKVFIYTWKTNSNILIKITGIMAIASLSGVAFSMAFDNVVSHSMTSLINPFIFIGFFLKFIDKSKYDRISQ